MKRIKNFKAYIKGNSFNQAELKYTLNWLGSQASVVLLKC
jgi:hypothetical protein